MHSKVSMLPAQSRGSHSAPNSLELSLVQEGIPGRSAVRTTDRFSNVCLKFSMAKSNLQPTNSPP